MDSVHVVGADCPVTAIALESVTCVFFTVAKFERYLGPAAEVLKCVPEVAISVKRKKSRVMDTNGFRNIRDLGEINYGKWSVGDIEETDEESGLTVVRRYVLKCISKARAVEAQHVHNVLDEVRVLNVMSSPFIVRLHGTFQTSDELVMVVPPVTGGDLWTYVRLYHSCDEVMMY